jgi:hypothetical protein
MFVGTWQRPLVESAGGNSVVDHNEVFIQSIRLIVPGWSSRSIFLAVPKDPVGQKRFAELFLKSGIIE